MFIDTGQSMPIFVINLKQDHEKRAHMQAQAERLGLEFTFVDAIYGKALAQEEVDVICDKERSLHILGRELFRGEVGCALSHLSIYRRMVDEGISCAIVLEDDVVVCEKVFELMRATEAFPRDWELALLGYHINAPENKNYRISFLQRNQVSEHFKTVRFTELMHGTIGYIVNLRGAVRLQTVLQQGIYKPIDHYTGNQTEINLYGIYPPCIQVESMLHKYSTIKEDRIDHHRKKVSREATTSLKLYIKRILQKMGLLRLSLVINRGRIVVVYELKSFAKRLTRPRRYREHQETENIGN